MPNDLVSIIIPCYNQAQYLEEAIQSAVDQTYPNIEIIIINDGSTDNSEEIASHLQKQYPEKIRIILQENSGVSEARNNAIRHSTGKYILPLDGDDKLHKTIVEKTLATLYTNDVDIVYTAHQCFGSQTKLFPRKPFDQGHILYGNILASTALYKKEIWENIKGYNKNMKEGYEDWEFWINAYKHNYSFHYLPETLFYYRTKPISRDTIALQNHHFLLTKKIILNHPELYPNHQVQEAISFVKDSENLADLYFYYNENGSTFFNKTVLIKIEKWLADNPLREKQILMFDDKKIALLALDKFKKKDNLQKFQKNLQADFILFYSPLRYSNITPLTECKYCWKKDEGIITVKGNIFPFVSKSMQKNSKSQLLAYKRLSAYQNKQLRILQQQTKNKDQTISEYTTSIQLLTNECNIYKSNLKSITNKIHKLIKYSIKKHPIKKYKAYKSLLQEFFTIIKKH